MAPKSLLLTVLISLLTFFSAVNSAQAQKLGPTTPWLGWRPLGTRFGVHYSTIHIYPTYGDSPYLSPASRYEPNSAPAVSAPAPFLNYAQVRVLIPSADAKVWFDGAPTTSTGAERFYYTPPIAQDGPNTYRIRAMWQEKGAPMVQEIVVSVRPGETAVADFTTPRPPR